METKIKQTLNWLRKEKNMREGHEPTDYIVLAIQALGKQAPQKVNNGEFCPLCTQYLNIRRQQQYCDKCGQKLDWD